MLQWILALPLLAPVDDDESGPDPEAVAAAVERLEKVFAAESVDEVASGIQSTRLVPAEEVVDLLVDRGLRHRERPVQRASIDVLGRLEHESALEALHRYLKRERKRLEDRGGLELLPPLLQAIARHGEESSIPVLVDRMFHAANRDVVRARILGLAMIRSPDSVAELIAIMRKSERRKVQPYMGDIRIALAVLTGQDLGTDQDRWNAWWNENRRTFRVPEQRPRLPEQIERRWRGYWGLPRVYDRQQRRERRGDDGDGRP